MKRFSSQFNKKAQDVRLSTVERSLLRERVVSYMEYHPLPRSAQNPKQSLVMTSEPYRVLKINYAYVSSLVGAFTVLLLIIVPVVAEKAMPGDVLYPVKVQFNEEVRSTLSFSPYAKVEWETQRLERRLSEARLLADEGKLTQEIEAEVAQAVFVHSEAAKHEIAAIRVNDSDEAAMAEIAFASALQVQSEALANREEQAGEVGRSVAALAGVVAQARNGADASQEASNPAYEKLLARLEIETTSAQELFTSVKEGASAEEIADIERRFADIERKISNSVALHTEAPIDAITMSSSTEVVKRDPQQEAKSNLKLALADTRKLISFLTHIDVRGSVSIEELVPLTLTPEEKRAAANSSLISLQESWIQIELVVPYSETVEKFTIGKAKLAELITAAVAAQAQDDFDTQGSLVTEGELMVADLMKLGVVFETSEVGEGEENQATSTDVVIEEEEGEAE